MSAFRFFVRDLRPRAYVNTRTRYRHRSRTVLRTTPVYSNSEYDKIDPAPGPSPPRPDPSAADARRTESTGEYRSGLPGTDTEPGTRFRGCRRPTGGVDAPGTRTNGAETLAEKNSVRVGSNLLDGVPASDGLLKTAFQTIKTNRLLRNT